jgi:hypothetical protein
MPTVIPTLLAIALALPGLVWAGYGWGEATRILAGAMLGAGGLWITLTLACAV